MFNLIISGAYMGLQVHNNVLPSRYRAGLSFLVFFLSSSSFYLFFIYLFIFIFYFLNLGSVGMGH
jgi:hypothetical protein